MSELSELRFTSYVEASQWAKIANAARLIVSGVAERIDGQGWKVYRAGTIIRIDLAQDFNPDDPSRA